MADTNFPLAGDVGLPSFASHSFAGEVPLFTGDTPVNTLPENVGQNTNLPAYSVVMRDGSGNLVLATLAGKAGIVGITVAPVVTGAGVATTVEVFKSGMFNPQALNWHADFTTDALKKTAFEGSAADGIQILKPRYTA